MSWRKRCWIQDWNLPWNERERLRLIDNESSFTGRFDIFTGLLNSRHLGGDFDTIHRAAAHVVSLLDVDGVQVKVLSLTGHRGSML